MTTGSRSMVNMVSGLLLRRIFLTVAETSSRVSLCTTGQWCGFTRSTSRFSESSLPNPDSVVSYKQLKNMLSTHNVQLFDVRNQDEFMAGRIPDSVNIPLGQLEETLKLSPEHFQLQFEVKAPGKDDDNIVFHCQKGRRSAEALAIARQLGFNRARHYQGGYSEWAAHEGKGVTLHP